MQQFFQSVLIALQNIRANPLHTFLSTLGIIIGVAAMVAILALGDGLEQTGREQLANTTSLNIINVSSRSFTTVDDVRVPIKHRPVITIHKAREIEEHFNDKAKLELVGRRNVIVSYQDSTTGAYLQGSMENGLSFTPDSILYGKYFSKEDVDSSIFSAVISFELAKKISDSPSEIIGNEVKVGDLKLKVVGIFEEKQSDVPRIFIPISVLIQEPNQYPSLTLKANKAEEIPEIEQGIKEWLNKNFEQGSEAFIISTNRARVEQFSQGILLFKLIMGAITGISVLVGGIGVMNVLLISVTERTKEIGIRKATGAKKKDIILQFLAESVTISFVGCTLGWITGIVGIFIFVPIVNSLVDIGNFHAAIGGGTVGAILIIGLLIGILFGTYPAWRAAQLTPVEAIRHE